MREDGFIIFCFLEKRGRGYDTSPASIMYNYDTPVKRVKRLLRNTDIKGYWTKWFNLKHFKNYFIPLTFNVKALYGGMSDCPPNQTLLTLIIYAGLSNWRGLGKKFLGLAKKFLAVFMNMNIITITSSFLNW